jgi:hypothetical protein
MPETKLEPQRDDLSGHIASYEMNKESKQFSAAKSPEQTVTPTPEAQSTEPQDKALQLMRKPFADNQISILCKPTKKDNPPGRCNACGGWHKLPAVQLSYVGHAALTDRLLEADPHWTWEPLAYAPNGTPLIDADGGMWIRLTVAGVTRLGYGDAQGKMGGDAMKERIGDALRNAAMRFGAALELWHKGGDLHAEEKNVDDKLAAEHEAEHLTKFQEREKVQPPPPTPASRPKRAEGVVVLNDIQELKDKRGKTYWRMDVIDVNGNSSLVSIWDAKLRIPELWAARGKDLLITVEGKDIAGKMFYNLKSIQQIGSEVLKPSSDLEEIPMFDGE